MEYKSGCEGQNETERLKSVVVFGGSHYLDLLVPCATLKGITENGVKSRRGKKREKKGKERGLLWFTSCEACEMLVDECVWCTVSGGTCGTVQ